MSTTWFVSRHPGARQWADSHGIAYDRAVEHIDPYMVSPGDCVIGTLPVDIVAALCARGVDYWHLSIRVPRSLRGVELDPRQLDALGACIRQYRAEPLLPDNPFFQGEL